MDQLLASGIIFYFDWQKKPSDEKINYWTMMGAPIIVTKDKKGFAITRRDTSERKVVSKNSLIKEINKTLDSIQNNLYKKAKEFHSSHLSKAKSWQEFEKIANGKKGFIETLWCGNVDCAKQIREKTNKNSIRVVNPAKSGNCVHCSIKAQYIATFAPAY